MCKSSFQLCTTCNLPPFTCHVLNLALLKKPQTPLSGVLNKSTLETSLLAVIAAEMAWRTKVVKRHLLRFFKTAIFG